MRPSVINDWRIAMNTITQNAADHVSIEQTLNRWSQAVSDKDLPRISEHYSSDVLAFDAVGQLQFKGRDAYMAHWQACMATCPGPTLFDMQQLHVELGQDLGFGHFLCHCGGTNEQGEMQSSWLRVSQGYRKQNGQWLIAHEHFSIPFDMLTGQTAFNLQP